MVGKEKGKGKGKCWSGMNPTISLVTEGEVVTDIAMVGRKTMEETGLMDYQWWWRQEGLQNWTSCKWAWCPKKKVGDGLLRSGWSQIQGNVDEGWLKPIETWKSLGSGENSVHTNRRGCKHGLFSMTCFSSWTEMNLFEQSLYFTDLFF